MTMSKGERGDGVKQLQELLDRWIKGMNSMGKNTGLIGLFLDGSFGPNTQIAVATYQKFISVSPSGCADDATLASLGLAGMDASGAITATGGGI